ncbi:hypothetical protein [Nocardia sp. NPDC051981]|uniref:hypothetical protein n=1 Tax=Nocardia sp. NPDC051981 TaxID=3155417 RepID=UPI00342EDFC9
MTARNTHNAALIEPDFEVLGWQHPEAGARLWVGLVAEAALLELRAGHEQGSVRNALWQFLPA